MAKTSALQIQDLAFNIWGHALRLPDDVSPVPTYVGTRGKGSTISYTEFLEKSRPTIAFAGRELQVENFPRSNQYLHIGYVPRNYCPQSHTRYSGTVGLIRPHQNDILKWNEKDPETWPLVAVAKLTDNVEDHVRHFVLLNPKFGLCKPYRIKQESVFYLAPFRNNANTLKEREADWRELIKIHTIDKAKNSLILKFTTLPDYADDDGHYDNDNFTEDDAQQLSESLSSFKPPIHCEPMELIYIRVGLVESRTAIGQDMLGPSLRQVCYKLSRQVQAFWVRLTVSNLVTSWRKQQ